MDSFRAVEIRNQLFRELQSDISIFEILSPRTLGDLSTDVAARSLLVPGEVKASGQIELD